MNADWNIGDLAVCVDAGRLHGAVPAYPLVEGRTYRVTGLSLSAVTHRQLLVLSECPPGAYADRFRKIRPDEHEGSAEDWQLIIETTKRKVKG